MSDRFSDISAFAVAFAAEYKGFMKAAKITGAQVASQLGRNEGYVSERVNGKRPLDTDDVDALATLAGDWSGRDLMIELARRVRSQDPRPLDNVTDLASRRGVGDRPQDEPTVKRPPATRRTAAKKGIRKADQEPHAE